jgi:hypothetical protein
MIVEISTGYERIDCEVCGQPYLGIASEYSDDICPDCIGL